MSIPRLCANCGQSSATGQFWKSKGGIKHWMCKSCSEKRTAGRKKARPNRITEEPQ